LPEVELTTLSVGTPWLTNIVAFAVAVQSEALCAVREITVLDEGLMIREEELAPVLHE
jgi:hypothetical protein